MLKVCLAGTYPAGTLEKFRSALDPDLFFVTSADTQEAFDAVTDPDVVVLRILKMPAPAFERFTNLKMVMRWGVGFDSVDIEEAGRRGVTVCNTPGANAYAVAELAVALMINVGRHVFGYYDNIHEGNWDREFFKPNPSLNGKTVGIIGGGNIGRMVAKRVQAFGAKTVYYDMFRLPEETEKEYGLQFTEPDELLKKSDIVSLHIPLTDQTRHFIDVDRIALMKKNGILINTARGGLIDEESLLEALNKGQLLGAGLDCVEQEDSEVTAKLKSLSNVIITPHIGGSASDLGTAIIPMILENLKLLQSGAGVKYIVNSQYLS